MSMVSQHKLGVSLSGTAETETSVKLQAYVAWKGLLPVDTEGNSDLSK